MHTFCRMSNAVVFQDGHRGDRDGCYNDLLFVMKCWSRFMMNISFESLQPLRLVSAAIGAPSPPGYVSKQDRGKHLFE